MRRVNLARTGGCACAIALALAVAGHPRQVAAAPAHVTTQLDYGVAPGCPPAEAFQSIVAGHLGYDPFEADAPNRVTIRIAAAGRTLDGRLEWRNASGRSIGQRSFPSRSGDCGELARAMGFALALQIQLMAMAAPQTASGAPSPPPATPTPAPAAPPVAEVAPPPPPPPPPPEPAARIESAPAPPVAGGPAGPWILVGAGVSGGLGLASDPVAVGRLFATAEWPHVAAELGGEIAVPSTTSRADGGGFSQQQLLATLAACGVLAPWSACAVAKIGLLRVQGQGVDVPLAASGLMAQTGVRLAAWHAFGRRTYIVARAEGLIRLSPETVTLDAVPVWNSPRFAALFGIDIGLRFR
jgi:hypothetical protein